MTVETLSAQIQSAHTFIRSRLDIDKTLFLIQRSESRRGKSRTFEFIFLHYSTVHDDVQIVLASHEVGLLLNLPRSNSGAVVIRESPELAVCRISEKLYGSPQGIEYRIL